MVSLLEFSILRAVSCAKIREEELSTSERVSMSASVTRGGLVTLAVTLAPSLYLFCVLLHGFSSIRVTARSLSYW